jgi:hypothetical protein
MAIFELIRKYQIFILEKKHNWFIVLEILF